MKRRIIKITLIISFVVLVAAVFMSRQYSVTHLEAQIEAAKEEGNIPAGGSMIRAVSMGRCLNLLYKIQIPILPKHAAL